MPRQRRLCQLKEQDKDAARDLREKDITNIPNGVFNTTITRKLIGLEKSMEDIIETLTTQIKELKKNESEMKNAKKKKKQERKQA